MLKEKPQLVSTSQLSADTAALVKLVRETEQPIIVMDHGEPAAVLVTTADFAALREHRRFLAAVEQGLLNVEEGRVLTTDKLKRSLETEFGPISWK